MSNLDGIRFTPEQRAWMRTEAAELYTDGATVAEVAAHLRCAPVSVYGFLREAGVELRPTKGGRIQMPEGMLTSKEAADMIGMTAMALAALHHKGEGPPRADRPQGAHGYYTYYWRRDIEQWLRERAARRLQRIQARKEQEKAWDELSVPTFTPNWPALMQAVDDKRSRLGLSWYRVCRMTGVDQGHMSRIRKGRMTASSIVPFYRLMYWVTGVPEEVKPFFLAEAQQG